MIIKESLPELSSEEKINERKRRMKLWRVMDRPELSLGPPQFFVKRSDDRSVESEANLCWKRKCSWDRLKTDFMVGTSIELQLKDPLPLDWEQCLDLESGKVYYLNRKTLKKSWSWPKDDLELSISTPSSSVGSSCSSTMLEDSKKHNHSTSNMVAVACLKCHLLVMLSKSCPFCPNCKYLYPLPLSLPPKPTSTKSLETLSLLI
ncbi:uncharacterized protein LOC131246328 [Magnolia sinica]|uniref:uncharacterized protein LOC131246328 n=1 Tax=Magnolia sinica TaxID=86752 RepID=UPI0026585187|nr:uncharacterized protein LOC131246328 [Magnolia sinica]